MSETPPLGDALIDQVPGNNPFAGLPPENIARMGIHCVDICGIQIDVVSLNALLSSIEKRIHQRMPGYVVTPNVHHICYWHRNEKFRRAYRDAFLTVPDGVPLMWSSRLLGTPLAQKLSGSDLIYYVSDFAARRGFSVYFLGADEGVAQAAASALTALYPGLRVAGCYSPPYGFEKRPETNEHVITAIKQAAPDICYLAFNVPKEEIWMHHNYRKCGVPIMIGMGASFDFVTGRQRRAPRAIQRAGFEWLWRMCLEPRRLWKRYLIQDVLFFKILAGQLSGHLRHPRRRAAIAQSLRACAIESNDADIRAHDAAI